MRNVLAEKSRTFFNMLAQGYKNEIGEIKTQLTIISYPVMTPDIREQFISSLRLPEDILGEILEGENAGDMEELKRLLG